MEAQVNEFTKRSKKYRTKYMDEISKLYYTPKTPDDRLIFNEVRRSENSDTVIADKK